MPNTRSPFIYTPVRWCLKEKKQHNLLKHSPRLLILAVHIHTIWCHPAKAGLQLGQGVRLAKKKNIDAHIQRPIQSSQLAPCASFWITIRSWRMRTAPPADTERTCKPTTGISPTWESNPQQCHDNCDTRRCISALSLCTVSRWAPDNLTVISIFRNVSSPSRSAAAVDRHW